MQNTRQRHPWKVLVHVEDPQLPTFLGWLGHATNAITLLPPNPDPAAREAAIEAVQATRRTTIGTLAWDTGGLIVDHGFLYMLGSGNGRIAGNLGSWNKAEGAIFVGYDVLGGMFALDDGALGCKRRYDVAYFAPDKLAWQHLDCDFGDFMLFLAHGDLAKFYGEMRWPSWKRDVSLLQPGYGWRFTPPLNEPAPDGRERTPSPMGAMLTIQLSHALRRVAREA